MSEWIRIRVKDFYKDAIGETEYTYVTKEVYKALTETFRKEAEYSCAATPQIRQTGNRLSGLAETAYASLLAQCFV